MSFISNLFARFFGGQAGAKIDDCSIAVTNLVVHYLFKRYAPEFGDEKESAALAAAVANDLFGNPPGNERGRRFLATNKSLVESRLRKIKDDPKICEMMTIFFCLRMMGAARTGGSLTPERYRLAQKLNELGIIPPLSEIKLPNSLDDCIQQIQIFENW